MLHLLLGVAIGSLAVRYMRRRHLRWTWAPAALALVMLVHASLGRATPTLAFASLMATIRARRWHREDIDSGELRGEESSYGAPLASATLGRRADGAPLLHRPDLVLWPDSKGIAADGPALPVAIEVELTVKAPRRLLEICRAWARCRCVAGVVYLAAPVVLRPLERAISNARAGERIAMLDLEGVIGRA